MPSRGGWPRPTSHPNRRLLPDREGALDARDVSLAVFDGYGELAQAQVGNGLGEAQ